MFCPGCGLQISEDLKYCRQCGMNLQSVRSAIWVPPAEENTDPGRNWWSEMVTAQLELKARLEGTPEEKRVNEIKGGIITSFVGIGIMIFLRFFMAVVAGQKDPQEAEIIRSVWLVGIIPFVIGIGFIFNGIFISRRLEKWKEEQSSMPALPDTPVPVAMPAKTTDHLIVEAPEPVEYSVTEKTTANLSPPGSGPTSGKSN